MNETMVEERVSRLEGIAEQVDRRLEHLDNRLGEVNQSIESLRTEIGSLRTETNARLEGMDRSTNARFAQIDARLNTLTTLMLGSTGAVLVAIIGAVVAFILRG